VAQFVVVDQVLVAKRDANDTPHHQRLDLVLDQRRIARVGEAAGQPTGQPDPPVGSAEKHCTGIRRYPPAVKRSHYCAPFHACKLKQARITLCQHRVAPLLSVSPLLQKNFRRYRGPVHLSSVRNSG
jgi:hypothetical protein